MHADTAVVSELLERRKPGSRLGGRSANVLVFPNLTAANASYKLLNRLGDAEVIGPILTGLARSVHILQLDADVGDVVNLTAIAMIDAHRKAAGGGSRRIVVRQGRQSLGEPFVARLPGVIRRRTSPVVAGRQVGPGVDEQVDQYFITVMRCRHERRAPVGLLGCPVPPRPRAASGRWRALSPGSDPATAAWSGWLWNVLLVHAPTSAPLLDQDTDGLGVTEEGGEVEGGEPVG